MQRLPSTYDTLRLFPPLDPLRFPSLDPLRFPPFTLPHAYRRIVMNAYHRIVMIVASTYTLYQFSQNQKRIIPDLLDVATIRGDLPSYHWTMALTFMLTRWMMLTRRRMVLLLQANHESSSFRKATISINLTLERSPTNLERMPQDSKKERML